MGFCPVGFCPSGVLSQWGFVIHSENIMTNFRAIMVYVFHFGLIISIEKLIQFDCCKGHLSKALIDQKHVTVYLELVG